MSKMQPIETHVLQAFQQIAPEDRPVLLAVRDLILDVAANTPRVGEVEETLRWGEPAYITATKKTGSTIRLGVEKGSGKPALFFNCKTRLVEEFRQKFGAELAYSKNRAVLLDGELTRLEPALRHCIAAALTYHLAA